MFKIRTEGVLRKNKINVRTPEGRQTVALRPPERKRPQGVSGVHVLRASKRAAAARSLGLGGEP